MSQADEVRQTGLETVGWRYVFGASGPNQIDCSGEVYWCMSQNQVLWKDGKSWPRLTAHDYAHNTVRIGHPLEVGDVAYWEGTSGHVYHIALCIGNGEMVEARGRAWGVVHYKWADPKSVHNTVKRKAKYGRFPWLTLGDLTEDDDLTPEEHNWLKELRQLVAPQSSYREAIANALLIDDCDEAQKLNDDFYSKWPTGVSGLPKGWRP